MIGANAGVISGVTACALGLAPEVRGVVDALYRVWLGTDTDYVR